MWYNLGVKKALIGIDEVGRGPVAGPVAVCAFLMMPEFELVIREFGQKNRLPIRDSKKLTKKQREKWAKFFKDEKQKGNCDFEITYIAPENIDKYGIAPSIRKALSVSLDKLVNHIHENSLSRCGRAPSVQHEVGLSENNFHLYDDLFVYLDGGLKAPDKFINQETVIKGDEIHLVISCASIVAKVARDAIMDKFSKDYPEYGFDKNSGYGTAGHIEAIKKHGLTPVHRKSFLKNYI